MPFFIEQHGGLAAHWLALPATVVKDQTVPGVELVVLPQIFLATIFQ
jgi:hypothetical protein